MIYTKYGMASIKKEVPGHFVKTNLSKYDNEPSRFQRNITVKIEVSKYNSNAGKLSL